MSQGTFRGKTGGNLPQIRSVCLIALGANYPFGEGDAKETILKGISAIQKDLGVIRSKSMLYRTPAFPSGSGPDFVNAALKVETDLSMAELLSGMHRIEAQFGRERQRRWAPRTLDLDLINYDDVIAPDRKTFDQWAALSLEKQMQDTPNDLILPHPRMHERAFVLIPLSDVAPDWIHPVFGKTISQMVDGLSADVVSEVERLQ